MVDIYAFPSHAPQLLQPLKHILLPHVWQCSLKKGFGFFGFPAQTSFLQVALACS